MAVRAVATVAAARAAAREEADLGAVMAAVEKAVAGWAAEKAAVATVRAD